MLVVAFLVPFRLVKQPMTHAALAVTVALAVTCVASLWLTLRINGYRVLRFITLIPLVIAFALTLRATAPILDYQQSSRWIVHAMGETAIGQIPTIAVYDVPRSVEYGLGFYRNRPVLSYERNQVPQGDHLVVAAAGAKTELEYRLRGRLVTRVGGFTAQHLDFYLVSGSTPPTNQP